MVIESLELEGFRNYSRTRAEFSRSVNVIIGGNAQGKTNMLEAIFAACTGRSFRARSDRELIGFDKDFARILAEGVSDERTKKVELVMRRGRRRQMSVNGVRLKTSGELAGNFSAVLFCPEDLELIRGGASVRRKLMDMCISQLRPRYAAALHEFNKAYEGKTRILRDFEEKPSLLELLGEYDFRLAQMSAELIHYRAIFVKRLAPEAAKIHADFSGGEELKIEYRTIKTIDDPERPASELLPMILEHQEKHRAAEAASGLCLTGAHKDDLAIEINGTEAKSFASQGQTRTAALSIKLAEREIHYSSRGEYPVLLLDDVLSELDAGRQDFILNRIGGGQVFITCCEDDRIAARTGGRVINIAGGHVV
ncbi:MAG: DNA replication/repair protein RecF [Oscillospiraceae bacterium]